MCLFLQSSGKACRQAAFGSRHLTDSYEIFLLLGVLALRVCVRERVARHRSGVARSKRPAANEFGCCLNLELDVDVNETCFPHAKVDR